MVLHWVEWVDSQLWVSYSCWCAEAFEPEEEEAAEVPAAPAGKPKVDRCVVYMVLQWVSVLLVRCNCSCEEPPEPEEEEEDAAEVPQRPQVRKTAVCFGLHAACDCEGSLLCRPGGLRSQQSCTAPAATACKVHEGGRNSVPATQGCTSPWKSSHAICSCWVAPWFWCSDPPVEQGQVAAEAPQIQW
jgi:hypothetical protein